jgi:receptor expression-enhancing protein 5/6
MCCITVLYPALHSIRAIITPDNTDDKEWLTYWMIYGVITFLETFLGFLLHFIPYYEYARLCYFAWLLLPQFRGSAHMYDLFLKDILANHKDTIQDLIDRTTSVATDIQADATTAAKNTAKKAMEDPNLVLKAASKLNDLANQGGDDIAEASPTKPNKMD